jgi:hypothetical protein
MSRTKQTQRKQIGKCKTSGFGYSIMKPYTKPAKKGKHLPRKGNTCQERETPAKKGKQTPRKGNKKNQIN